MRQFRQIDTFGTAWLFVAPNYAERKHIQRCPLGFVAHAGNNLGKKAWLRQFRLDDLLDSRAARMCQNRVSLLLADGPICIRRRYREPHDL